MGHSTTLLKVEWFCTAILQSDWLMSLKECSKSHHSQCNVTIFRNFIDFCTVMTSAHARVDTLHISVIFNFWQKHNIAISRVVFTRFGCIIHEKASIFSQEFRNVIGFPCRNIVYTLQPWLTFVNTTVFGHHKQIYKNVHRMLSNFILHTQSINNSILHTFTIPTTPDWYS